MAKIATNLSDREQNKQKVIEEMRTMLSECVDPSKLEFVRKGGEKGMKNEPYISIVLDDKQGKRKKQICCIKFKPDGSLKSIVFPKFEYFDSPSNKILSHKSRLLQQLLEMHSKWGIPLP